MHSTQATLERGQNLTPPRLVQLALNTSDLSASLRLYAEAFGFVNAGGSPAWGKVLAMQDLPEAAHCMVWWLIGSTPLFQLELFHHGFPVQRPLRQDWLPSDLGWVRFGISVSDFDRVVKRLDHLFVAVLGRSGHAPARKLAFRDPFVGVIVEVIERLENPAPSVLYVTSSVADIHDAREFYGRVIGGHLLPLECLRKPADQALWGLQDAHLEGFVVELQGGLLEIVSYSSPRGRPRRPDYRSSDQGIMNVALGSRRQDDIRALIRRVQDSGVPTTVVVDSELLTGTYITQSGYELELMSIPEELETRLGFKPASPFINDIGS